MAVVSWPVELPVCAQAWRESPTPDVLTTEMEVGPPKVRLRSSIVRKSVSVSWTLPAAKYEIFKEFYLTDCLAGVNLFDFPNPVTGELERYRFSEPPQFEFIGNGNRVGAFRVVCSWERDS